MNRILVGLDGSKNAYEALEEGIRLALFYKAELHTVSVEGEKEFADSKYKEIIEKAQKMAADQNCPINPHILVGHEVKTIIEFIQKNKVDLLIIGFIGVSAVYERVMGSTSASLVSMAPYSPCSVLVVK